MSEPEVYYRFDASTWGDDISIWAQRIPVIAHTKCGVWLGHQIKEHFVLNGPGKRYAYPTVEAAWDSYQRRKIRQLGFLTAQHDHVSTIVNAIRGKAYDDLKNPDGEVRLREKRDTLFFEVT